MRMMEVWAGNEKMTYWYLVSCLGPQKIDQTRRETHIYLHRSHFGSSSRGYSFGHCLPMCSSSKMQDPLEDFFVPTASSRGAIFAATIPMWHREIGGSYFGQERVVHDRCCFFFLDIFFNWNMTVEPEKHGSHRISQMEIRLSTIDNNHLRINSFLTLPRWFCLWIGIFWWSFMVCTLFQGLCLHVCLFEVVLMHICGQITHTKKTCPQEKGTY